MSARPLPHGFQRHPFTGAIAISLVVGLLAGCAGVLENRPDYARANLAQGRTFACYSDPCAVTLTLPPGDGEYTVHANGRVLGAYPAGKPVDLGSFSRQESPVTFTVDGAEHGASVLYVLAKYQHEESRQAADQ
ncbi:MAG: hypothetical protein MUF57_09385 [Gammaproteobacteria bacterium]|jgi:hypothetical protein|nr:hypothetical protein [Gammaproteobacteria bacterium]